MYKHILFLLLVLPKEGLVLSNYVGRGFPGGSVVKNLPANAGTAGSIPGLGRSPGDGNHNPLQYSCLGKPHGQRSLVGYIPWGPNESDTAYQPSNTVHTTPTEG